MNSLYISRTGFTPDIFIQTDDENLTQSLRNIYYPFIREKYSINSQTLKLSVYEENSTVYFQCIDEICRITKGASLQAIENAIYENTSVDKQYLSLHAAVVAQEGRAYIFAGKTKTGKTTLCAYLTAHGYEYLSDDIVLIDKKTLKVTPFSNPMNLRPDSIGVLQKHGVDINDLVEVKYGDIHRFIKYPNKKTELIEYDIDSIFFIERDTKNNDIERLPAYLSFQKILESQVNPANHSLVFETIKNLMSIEIYKVRYSDMSYIDKLIVPNI